MATPINNFALGILDAGIDDVVTSFDLQAGHGSRFPSTFPYPGTIWNATDYPHAALDPNKEIVSVTNRAGDTFTILRAQEGTTGVAHNTSSKQYLFQAGITKAVYDSLLTHALAQTFRGLTIGTHTDSDKQTSQVRLLHADAIVMSDGEQVLDWNNVDFDIAAAAGIGGLDTGSEFATAWYEIHAMWNGTTKGLIGHRCKDYFLDEEYATGEDATQGCRSAVDNSTIKVDQGFQVDTAGPLPFIDVKLIQAGAVNGNVWFTIEADNAGAPSGTPLATSQKYDASQLSTTAAWVRIAFDSPFSLSALTQYHLVMQGDWTVNATNYIGWRMDGSSASYARGSKALFDSDTATWTTDTDDDMQFRVYVTRNDTSLTIPAGYRSALISYVFNASGNFFPYVQHDRVWRWMRGDSTVNQIVNELAAATTLYDCRSFFPASPSLMAWFAVSGTGAAGASCALGNISQPNVTLAVNQTYQLHLMTTGTSEGTLSIPGSLIMRYNAVMAYATAGADLWTVGFDL